MKLARSQVALGILAGGQASRMGGTDKALAMHEGTRLGRIALHVARRCTLFTASAFARRGRFVFRHRIISRLPG